MERYSGWLACRPIRSDAARYGWTTRKRLYWIRGRSKIPQLCDARCQVPRQCSNDLHLRCANTVWEPGKVQAFSWLLDAHAVVEHMRSQLQHCYVPDEVLFSCRGRLAVCDLPLMQAFPAWQCMRGADYLSLPPALLHARARTRVFAGNSGQRYSSEHAKGLDHLLPPGLGKEAHMRQALALPSPFQAYPWPDEDVQFVADTVCVFCCPADRRSQVARSFPSLLFCTRFPDRVFRRVGRRG